MDEEDSRSCLKPFKALVNLVLVAFAVTLAITTCSQTSDTAQTVLVGMFCTLGMIATAVMLLVLVRQSYSED